MNWGYWRGDAALPEEVMRHWIYRRRVRQCGDAWLSPVHLHMEHVGSAQLRHGPDGRDQCLVSALLETRRLAAQTTHVVEVLAAHLVVAHDLDLINAGGVQQETALDTDVVRDAAHSE